jgi:acetyl-CoA synthetase
MLACTRIGAPHSVVFAGFSADSLRDRIMDASSKWVVTSDQGVRGGRVLPLKQIVDTAVAQTPCVQRVFVFERTGAAEVVYNPDVDVRMKEELGKCRPYCPAESMDSEDTLFLLYTSGECLGCCSLFPHPSFRTPPPQSPSPIPLPTPPPPPPPPPPTPLRFLL